MRLPFFYGWVIVALAWLIYGFGIAPAYFSWGFFAPEAIDELGLSRREIGLVFGAFTFLYSASSPLVGLALLRFNLRTIICAGSLLAATGFMLLSRAETLFDFLLAFSVCGGMGIGISTIIPCQTLGSNWFIKSRARAIAIIMTAGGIVGSMMAPLDKWMLDSIGWRSAWIVIGGISISTAVLAVLFVRDRPEDLGLGPDGDPPIDPVNEPAAPVHASVRNPQEWTAREAMRTPQFLLLIVCGVAYAVPWGVVAAHGRLHLEDLGFSTATVAGVFSISIGLSVVGRLSGAVGDFLAPHMVLGSALMLEAAGMGGFLIAETPAMAYASFALLGLGFGMAYINVAVVFSSYFGRSAFAATAGVRIMITGVFNAIGPWLAGEAYDRFETYSGAFVVLIVVGFAGGVSAFLCRPPHRLESSLAVEQVST